MGNLTKGNLTKVQEPNRLPLTPHVPQELLPYVDGDKHGFDSFGIAKHDWWNPSSCPSRVKEQLPALIEQHEQASLPAAPEFAILELTRLAAHHQQRDRTEQQWQVVFEDMLDDLAEIPADILKAAITQHRRTSVFFPKIVELLTIAEPMVAERKWRVKRMRQLLSLPTPEELAERQRIEAERKAADYAEMLKMYPDLRIRERWMAPIGRHISLMEWTEFLRNAVAAFDEETVDGWHAQLAERPGLVIGEHIGFLRRQFHIAHEKLLEQGSDGRAVRQPAAPAEQQR